MIKNHQWRQLRRDFQLLYKTKTSKTTVRKCYPFNAPTKGVGKKCLLLAQNIYTLQYLVAIYDRKPTVALSSEHVVIQHLIQMKETILKKDV